MQTATVKKARYHKDHSLEDELDFNSPEVRAEVDPYLAKPEPAKTPDNIDPDTGALETAPLDAEQATYKKRYGDLRRYQQEQAAEFKKELASIRTQLAEATNKNIELPKTEAEVKDWAERYPDVYGIVETIAKKSVLAERETVSARLEEIENMRRDVTRDRAENKIRKSHPDFDELRGDEHFHEWVSTKPKWVQDALYVNDDDAEAVIGVLDYYKLDKAAKEPKVAPKRPVEDARQAAQLVARTRTVSDITASPEGDNKIFESQVKKMSPRQYERMEPEIDKAIREKRFVYDISGGAR